ncbi:uncharacterized protein Bfra_010928 [Botrytis fragariae]|uniref:Uncharacterized protein n=1 Tax=Botrytis fragariae TaxID=1964551 RepID=A0A8H6ALX6_9HELO|nr:uncharacterized protein Bfra_010928 [Botrytis fragariae]KAF5869728.1 hypothetical protein Bfra_010928 [Botrytis fragariae]
MSFSAKKIIQSVTIATTEGSIVNGRSCSGISIHGSSLASRIPRPIQTTSPVFSMVDFRLFHHFIQEAYPHHPIWNDSVWTHEIPSIASDHDYLLRSMLVLSASDLASDPTYSTASCKLTYTAIHHRVKAIASRNAAISSGVN